MLNNHPNPLSYWSLPAEQALETLKSQLSGLSASDAEARLAAAGPNLLVSKAKATPPGAFPEPI